MNMIVWSKTTTLNVIGLLNCLVTNFLIKNCPITTWQVNKWKIGLFFKPITVEKIVNFFIILSVCRLCCKLNLTRKYSRCTTRTSQWSGNCRCPPSYRCTTRTSQWSGNCRCPPSYRCTTRTSQWSGNCRCPPSYSTVWTTDKNIGKSSTTKSLWMWGIFKQLLLKGTLMLLLLKCILLHEKIISNHKLRHRNLWIHDFPSSLSHNLLGSSLEITVKYFLCSELWKIQLILKKPMPRKQLESRVFSIDETALNTGNSGSVQNKFHFFISHSYTG